MWLPAAQPETPRPLAYPDPSAAWYSVLGVPIAVVSDVAEALARIDETYIAFRQDGGAPATAYTVELRHGGAGDACTVGDSRGERRAWPDAHAALLDALDRLVHAVLAGLHARGVYAIHAGATVDRDAALIVSGRSGQGKTTLVLGLLRRGLGLLSDEFAIVDPAAARILPYRRSLHIRPGTPELIPELRFLHDRPQHRLGGGIEWALTPADLDRALPGRLAPAAPLRYVLLLDGDPRANAVSAIAPLPAAVATMELLRGTWAASIDFADGLARIGRLLDGVACARLRVGALEPTLDTIMRWLEEHGG